ncbi:hypothetical protein [Streptomyces sp. CRN 30]|uniref:hypothetical protein n=1 Tax=Streptomyces sp. CRN 30 TaxID=3075613 RepID=UPI002A80BAD9|nr:hypothetical protein [Streptomyces sp. CRN 30]
MKKRSMCAIASLAAGFVAAAVTPSHALGGLPIDLDKATNALNSVNISEDSLAPREADKKPKG